MNSLDEHIIGELNRHGADLIGIGNLEELPGEARNGLPIGISVALKYPKEIICGISELPTQEYRNWYNTLNERLDALVTYGAGILKDLGYEAIARTRACVGNAEEKLFSALPHKTVATRAGLGWIGKCALLVTPQYGSMIRLSSILTNAPLTSDEPINQSKCGDCMVCKSACPGGAVSGKAWSVELFRDEFFNPILCRDTAHDRSKRGFGSSVSLCGKCIEVCPYTQRYIRCE